MKRLRNFQSEYKDELYVTRASLSFDVPLFLENREVAKTIREEGLSTLPIVTIDGKIVSKQRYPRYAELRNEDRRRAKLTL